MRVLITGITGFVGSHMAELALAKGAEVFGTYRWRSRMDNIQHLLSQIRLIECDLRDAISVRNALKEAKPDWIFHLAAQSYVPTSWSAPADTMVRMTPSKVSGNRPIACEGGKPCPTRFRTTRSV